MPLGFIAFEPEWQLDLFAASPAFKNSPVVFEVKRPFMRRDAGAIMCCSSVEMVVIGGRSGGSGSREMRRYLIVLGVLLGLVAAASTFELEHLASSPAVIFLMPGMLVAIVAAGNVHVWPVWIAALGNFVFYFLFIWLAAAIWAKVGAKFG
jgi:hypothetical protein